MYGPQCFLIITDLSFDSVSEIRNSETAAGVIFFAGAGANTESLRFLRIYMVLIVTEVTHLNAFIMLCEDASHVSPVNKKKIMC